MARPIKNNADYFPHETAMRNDRRVRSLRKKHGEGGYGIYCMLLEILTESQGLQVELNPLERQLILDDLDLEESLFTDVIDTLLMLGLMQRDDNNVLRCKSLDSRLEPIFTKRNRSLEVIREFLGVSGVETNSNPQINNINTHRREENRIGENSILTKTLQILFDEFYATYPNKQARTKAELAFSRVSPDKQLFEDMMASLNGQIKAGEFENDFQKAGLFPESWLSQNRWTDEPKPRVEEGF